MQQDGREENLGGLDSGASTPSSPKVPDHELIRCIGAGAFGEVWLAAATSLPGAYRAVKVVRRDSLQGSGFAREFRGIQNFEPISRSHPNLVNILHVGENTEGGYFFYVMELADDVSAECGMRNAESIGLAEGPDQKIPHSGLCAPNSYAPKTLRSELQRRGRLPFEECLEIALSLTAALVHLHRHGLIHRDVKPANIIFVKGVAKLADIGLVADAESASTFVGTEGYIPREGPGAPQADIYSLGKVFYEMVSGLDRTLFPQLPDGWAAQRNMDALIGFNDIVLRACEGDVSLRYQTAEELGADLFRLRESSRMNLEASGGRKLKLSWKAALVGAALLLASGAFVFYKWADSRARITRAHKATSGSTHEETAGSFKALFNGKDLDGWSAPGNNWACSEGSLTRVASGGDITYEQKQMPDNFDLQFEWKVAAGSDSGVLYRPGRVEYQILDNAGSPLGSNRRTWAGSLFDYSSQAEDRTKPVGQWNTSRVLCEGDRIRHYLNGAVVLDTHYTRPDWEEDRNRLKAKYNTDLGARGGFLVLRDEKGQVWYRNIRLKALE